MIKIPEILNPSDDLSEESGSGSIISSTQNGTSLSSTTSVDTFSKQDGVGFNVKSESLPSVSDESLDSASDLTPNSVSPVKEEEEDPISCDTQVKPSKKLRSTIPKPKINKKLLNKRLVQVAIRRKSTPHLPKFSENGNPSNSKLHIKSLEAGLRVKLTLAPDLISLYNSLTPHTGRQKSLKVFNSTLAHQQDGQIVNNNDYLSDINLETKLVQLIDNNLVNMSIFSKKIMKSFNNNSDSKNSKNLPTFNSLNTAVRSLFNLEEFSLVRITRSTTNDYEGSVLLKFETAKPGDYGLIDDEDFADDLAHSIGNPGDDPTNLFIKKVVARPRYKSDMKLYLIPKNVDSSLYVDKRMFERDLVNNIIDDSVPFYKDVFCAFEFKEILENFKSLLLMTQNPNDPNNFNYNAPSNLNIKYNNFMTSNNAIPKPMIANISPPPSATSLPTINNASAIQYDGKARNNLSDVTYNSQAAINPNTHSFYVNSPSTKVVPPISGNNNSFPRPQLPSPEASNSSYGLQTTKPDQLKSSTTIQLPSIKPHDI